MSRDPLTYRNPELLHSLLAIIYDTDQIAWTDLLDLYTTTEHPWRTIEATLYDLIAYGAVHRIGQPATRNRPDTRALKPTPLGRAWLNQELLPPPGDPT